MNIGTPEVSLQPDWLTTHLLTIGMTGSGKTGLGIVLLEELYKGDIPLIVLDIKGDLCNMMAEHPRHMQVYTPASGDELPPTTEQLLTIDTDKAAVSFVYLAHLDFDERTQIISAILDDLGSYLRKQGGSDNLRGLLHIDEVHGLIPPVKKSPVKTKLMRLLKTARGYGFGISLATQNPGDLDYKALSNIGTWIVGKLNTDRDRNKVAEGSSSSVSPETLRDLEHRQFSFRSTHSSESLIFTSRDVESGIGGPLSLNQALKLTPSEFKARYVCEDLDIVSRVGATRETFEQECSKNAEVLSTARLTELKEIAKNKNDKLERKLKGIRNKIEAAESQKKDRGIGATVGFAAAIVGAITGKSAINTSTISRVGTAARHGAKAKSAAKKLNELVSERDLLAEELRQNIISYKAERDAIRSGERVVVQKESTWNL